MKPYPYNFFYEFFWPPLYFHIYDEIHKIVKLRSIGHALGINEEKVNGKTDVNYTCRKKTGKGRSKRRWKRVVKG